MLHTCTVKFDVTENLENFLVFEGAKQGLSPVVAKGPRAYRGTTSIPELAHSGELSSQQFQCQSHSISIFTCEVKNFFLRNFRFKSLV